MQMKICQNIDETAKTLTKQAKLSKVDFTLVVIQAECRGDIAVFCSCTCVKVLITNAFLKCRFRLKVKIISTFPLRTNASPLLFLNQSF